MGALPFCECHPDFGVLFFHYFCVCARGLPHPLGGIRVGLSESYVMALFCTLTENKNEVCRLLFVYITVVRCEFDRILPISGVVPFP